jgi:hypothetical protein
LQLENESLRVLDRIVHHENECLLLDNVKKVLQEEIAELEAQKLEAEKAHSRAGTPAGGD